MTYKTYFLIVKGEKKVLNISLFTGFTHVRLSIDVVLPASGICFVMSYQP
jgi:hypothetical protein